MRIWLLIRYPLFVLAMIAFVVVWSVTPGQMEQRWADLEEVHAAWDGPSNTLQLSLMIRKRAHCGNVFVSKNLRRIIRRQVQEGEQILLFGSLWRKILALDKGEKAVRFDVARPARTPASGDYLLTIQAFCEQAAKPPNGALPEEAPTEASPTALPSLPVSVTIEVSGAAAKTGGHKDTNKASWLTFARFWDHVWPRNR